jgi:HK97 family phage portal protein
MGRFTPLIERRTSVQPSILAGDPALASYFGGGNNSRSNQNVNADSCLAVSTVYACVNRIGKCLAMIPLESMRRLPKDGHEIATDFRLYRQLNSKPNRWQTSYEWRLMGMLHVQLRGNFYCAKIGVPGRGLNELVPLDPDRVYPFVITPSGVLYYMYDNSPVPPQGSILYYQYYPINGDPIVFNAGEVLHIRGVTSNGIVGKNVVKLFRESVGLSLATEEQGARLFSNGAQISKLFTHPGKIDDEAFDRLREQISEYSGVHNSHRTMILEGGMDIKQLNMTMEDSQFLETRKFQVEDLCSFLDVPMMLIHRSGDKNQTFASAEIINQMFITHNMQPHFVNWEQRLNEDLLYDSERSKYYFNFNIDEIMRGDSVARAAYYNSRFQTASLTPNDIKRKEGETPYDNNESDATYLQSGMLPAKLAGQQAQPVKPITKVEGD